MSCFDTSDFRIISDSESLSMDILTEEEYEQTGMIELGDLRIMGIDDDDQTTSVDVTLDQALSEEESIATGPPHQL